MQVTLRVLPKEAYLVSRRAPEGELYVRNPLFKIVDRKWVPCWTPLRSMALDFQSFESAVRWQQVYEAEGMDVSVVVKPG
jgi:hypothetical protein